MVGNEQVLRWFLATLTISQVSGAGLRSSAGPALSPAELEDAEEAQGDQADPEVQAEGGFVPVGFRRSTNLLMTASSQQQPTVPGPFPGPGPVPAPAPGPGPSGPSPGMAPLLPGPLYTAQSPLALVPVPAPFPFAPRPAPFPFAPAPGVLMPGPFYSPGQPLRAPSPFPFSPAPAAQWSAPFPGPRPFPVPAPAPLPAPVLPMIRPPAGLVPLAWPPAPFPAPGPAPRPFPFPAPAPAPYTGVATVTMVVEQVDYSVVVSDPLIRSGLEDVVKSDIAEMAGNGISPNDITTTFSEGSVLVTATVTPHNGISAAVVQDSLCAHTADLQHDLEDDISHVDHITQATTGTLGVGELNACGTASVQTIAYVAPGPAPAAFPFAPVSVDNGLDNCNPACVPGQGICSDNLCFCKTPYTGVRCERALSLTQIYRIRYPMASGILFVCVILGAVFGTLFWHIVLAPKYKRVAQDTQPVKTETWEPAK